MKDFSNNLLMLCNPPKVQRKSTLWTT